MFFDFVRDAHHYFEHTSSAVFIFGLVVYGDEPTIISFDTPEVYEGFKSYFDMLWQKS